MKNIFALSATLLLAGCVAQAETVPEDPPLWGRVDCQRLADNPTLQLEFEQAKTICLSRAQAASVAGTANMPEGHGLGGAMVAGINQGAAANQISTATATGCMGEMGYLMKTKSEHLAMCAAIKEQRERIAAASPTSKKRPARQPSLSAVVSSPAKTAAPSAEDSTEKH
jgi:hypothetical protein